VWCWRPAVKRAAEPRGATAQCSQLPQMHNGNTTPRRCNRTKCTRPYGAPTATSGVLTR
jgi:hypothetical protein